MLIYKITLKSDFEFINNLFSHFPNLEDFGSIKEKICLLEKEKTIKHLNNLKNYLNTPNISITNIINYLDTIIKEIETVNNQNDIHIYIKNQSLYLYKNKKEINLIKTSILNNSYYLTMNYLVATKIKISNLNQIINNILNNFYISKINFFIPQESKVYKYITGKKKIIKYNDENRSRMFKIHYNYKFIYTNQKGILIDYWPNTDIYFNQLNYKEIFGNLIELLNK